MWVMFWRFHPCIYVKIVLQTSKSQKLLKIMEKVIAEHIEITPGVCGGKPRIAGHRVKVQDVVIWSEEMGMSPDEILYHYPSLTLSDVYAALAYYHDNREEIRRQIREDEAFAREMESKTPSLLQEKLKSRKNA